LKQVSLRPFDVFFERDGGKTQEREEGNFSKKIQNTFVREGGYYKENNQPLKLFGAHAIEKPQIRK
jgi:hypothetical protein